MCLAHSRQNTTRLHANNGKSSHKTCPWNLPVIELSNLSKLELNKIICVHVRNISISYYDIAYCREKQKTPFKLKNLVSNAYLQTIKSYLHTMIAKLFVHMIYFQLDSNDKKSFRLPGDVYVLHPVISKQSSS